MSKQTLDRNGPTNWGTETDKANANFTELYNNALLVGIYDYNDAATAVTPLTTVAGVPLALTNDEAGPFTNKTYALASVADVWDEVAQAFDFSSLPLGSSVDIRLDIEVTTDSNNQDISVDLVVADGEVGEYTLPFLTKEAIKTQNVAEPFLRFNSIYLGDANTRDNPARFKITTEGTASVVVRGWYCRVFKKGLA